MKRILAVLLTVLTLLGTLTVGISAKQITPVYVIDDKTKKETDEIDYEKTLEKYLTTEITTPEAKLEEMELMYEKDGYQLWGDQFTGEVAVKNMASGQILFSNPYDVYSSGTDSIKKQLLSQVVIKYTDNDTEKLMYSFTEAAQRGQIKFKNIKNGIRVEYTIGREENRMLVPKQILKERFEENILDVFAAEINAESRELAEKNGNTTVTYGGYIWPCSSKYVTSPLGARYTGIAGASRNHAGIDIGRVGYTTQAVAAKAGTVIISAYNKYRGNYVVVSHGSGNTTTYQHLSSRSVSVGTYVAQGQVVGITGTTGVSSGPHLHFEITENGQIINPLKYLTDYIKGW